MAVLCGLLAVLPSTAAAAPELAGVAALSVDFEGEAHSIVEGQAVVGANARPMTLEAPVRIASVSKLVTAIGAMRLVEAGVLDLDRDVSGYLGYRLRNPAHADVPVTLRQLLSHTSSVRDHGGYSWPLGERLRDRLGQQSFDARYPPGAGFSYANLNFGIVGEVMEAATGIRFDRLMQQLLFTPLALDACFNWSGCSAEALSRAATLYRKGVDETAWDSAGPWIAQADAPDRLPPGCPVRLAAAQSCALDSYRPGDNGTLFAPQGGLRISVRDLGRIARLLLRGGELGGVRLLRPQTVDLMFAPAWQGGTPTGETYGGLMRCYGLSVQCLIGGADQPLARPTRWHGHMGEAYGLYSGLWIAPAEGRAYIYAITGTGDDPAKFPGRRSRFTAFEETLLERLAR